MPTAQHLKCVRPWCCSDTPMFQRDGTQRTRSGVELSIAGQAVYFSYLVLILAKLLHALVRDAHGVGLRVAAVKGTLRAANTTTQTPEQG